MNSESIVDPRQAMTACGGRISDPGCYQSTNYKNRQIYFCLPSCPRAFEADPEVSWLERLIIRARRSENEQNCESSQSEDGK
jgi:hypothetical protein